MDQPVRDRAPARPPRGLTSPDPVTTPPTAPPAARQTTVPAKNTGQAAQNVSGRKATPATNFKISHPSPRPETITRIHAVDRGLVSV